MFFFSFPQINNYSVKKEAIASGEAVIKHTLANYESLQVYLDSTIVINGEITSKDSYQKTFSLSFIRPNYFEFHGVRELLVTTKKIETGFYYNEHTNQSIAWAKRGNSPLERVDRPFGNGIARMVGTFGVPANLVPNLLLPEKAIGVEKFSNYERLEQLPNETIRGQECHVIHLFFKEKEIGNANGGSMKSDMKYWIRKDDFYIIRYRLNLSENKWSQITSAEIYPLIEKAHKLQPRAFAY